MWLAWLKQGQRGKEKAEGGQRLYSSHSVGHADKEGRQERQTHILGSVTEYTYVRSITEGV